MSVESGCTCLQKVVKKIASDADADAQQLRLLGQMFALQRMFPQALLHLPCSGKYESPDPDSAMPDSEETMEAIKW